jgi:hypothetical protein
MALGFLPAGDAALLAWSANFNSLINASASSYGLTTPLATAYGSLHAAYATSLAACDPGVRNKATVLAKNQARFNLKNDAKLLANLVNGTASVTNAQKVTLGLNIRAVPSPIPAPSSAPGLDIGAVSGWTVKVKLHDSASSAKRGKPPGVSGAAVFSYVGVTAPADISAWKFEGNTGRTNVEVAFPSTVAAGA